VTGVQTCALPISGLTNGTAYTFKIAAVNLAGTGTAATSSAFTPRTVPNAPTSVRAVADNTTGIDLSWNAPDFNGGSEITDYVVEYATENTDYVVFADGVSTGTSVKVTGLTQGVEYTFRIAAKNIAGQGAYSAETLDAIATARTVPGAPTATASSTRDGAIELEWKFVAPETDGGSEIIQYDVEWAKVGTSVWSGAAYDYRTTRIEGLQIGTQYKFRTTATNAAGKGKYSAEVVAIPPRVPVQSMRDDGTVLETELLRKLFLEKSLPS
jgi:titin